MSINSGSRLFPLSGEWLRRVGDVEEGRAGRLVGELLNDPGDGLGGSGGDQDQDGQTWSGRLLISAVKYAALEEEKRINAGISWEAQGEAGQSADVIGGPFSQITKYSKPRSCEMQC